MGVGRKPTDGLLLAGIVGPRRPMIDGHRFPAKKSNLTSTARFTFLCKSVGNAAPRRPAPRRVPPFNSEITSLYFFIFFTRNFLTPPPSIALDFFFPGNFVCFLFYKNRFCRFCFSDVAVGRAYFSVSVAQKLEIDGVRTVKVAVRVAVAVAVAVAGNPPRSDAKRNTAPPYIALFKILPRKKTSPNRGYYHRHLRETDFIQIRRKPELNYKKKHKRIDRYFTGI